MDLITFATFNLLTSSSVILSMSPEALLLVQHNQFYERQINNIFLNIGLIYSFKAISLITASNYTSNRVNSIMILENICVVFMMH